MQATSASGCAATTTGLAATAAARMENRCGAAQLTEKLTSMWDSRSARTATTTSGMCCSHGTCQNCGDASPSPCAAHSAELRATGADPDAVRVSFIKVVELQARLIPHIHALIRLDPPDGDNCGGHYWQAPLTATELATIVQQAARTVAVTVTDPSSDTATRVIRFGTQVDTQPIDNRHAGTESPAVQDDSPHGRMLPGRRVARYLAKYVTKSLADVGISARRISTEAIANLDVSDHVRAILTTISQLADRGLAGVGRWLHTLGYRGHITSKSRRYSTTMTALRERRATWTREQRLKSTAYQHDLGFDPTDSDDLVVWEFDRAGLTSLGDRTLVNSAALRCIDARRIGLMEVRGKARNQRWDLPGGCDG